MADSRFTPYPKKNWSKEAFQKYLDEKGLETFNLDDYDFESDESKESLISLIKKTSLEILEAEIPPAIEEYVGIKEQLYPIRVYGKHSCYIGGERYEFLPNHEYYVTNAVRQVLIDARLVLR